MKIMVEKNEDLAKFNQVALILYLFMIFLYSSFLERPRIKKKDIEQYDALF